MADDVNTSVLTAEEDTSVTAGTETVVEEKQEASQEADVNNVADADKSASETEGGDPASQEVVYDLTFSEDVTVDEDLKSEFVEMAKENKLSKEQAQALADFHIKNQKATLDKWADTVKGWKEATQKDKEIGGKEFNQKVSVARKALKEYGTPELTAVLDAYGMSNHPEVIRLFYRVGKTLKEDSVESGGQPKGEVRDIAKLLFPNMS